MTRDQQAAKEAEIRYREHPNSLFNELAFRAGADWADRTMIERVTDWVEENICDAHNYRGDSISGGKVRDELLKAMKQ